MFRHEVAMRMTYRIATLMATTWILVAGAFPLTFPGAAQVAPRSTAPPGPRTGMIVGQVVDATTGDAVSEAIVRLAMSAYPEHLPDSPNGRVMADAEGRFFFTALPAGDYYLQATREGHAPGTYGQRRPWGESQPVTLGEGERRTDIELRLWKHAVIGGTVVDEAGEPVVGTTVRALVRDVFAGRTRYGNMQFIPELAPTATTDDRGMFRLPQLSPGTYVVVVPFTQATVPAGALGNLDPPRRNELFRAGVHEISPLGQPRTLQVGDFAVLTLNRVLIPPPPTLSGRMSVYPTTYYPAATTAAAATPIAVRAGEERADLTIVLRPVPAVRVSGLLVAPDGSVPPPMTLRLVGEAMADVITPVAASGPEHVGFETVTGLSDERGRFALVGVPAGQYVLRHANPFLVAAVREGRPAYCVSQPVTVGSEDITDLAVELRPALRLEGRLEFRRGGGPQPTPPPRLVGIMFETPFGEPGQVAAEVSRDTWSFSTVAAGGQYIVRPHQADGWFVQSVTVEGKDITDRVFDLRGHTTSLAVTYTDRPSRVSGLVTDERGAASATAVVLAFPVDSQRWSGYGASPRTMRSALTTRSGSYTFDHLPPGEYYLIAVEPAETDGWRDPARLEALAAQATRLSVASGDPLRSLDLRVRTVQ